MDLKHLVRGMESAHRLRRSLAKTGETLGGQPLWTKAEDEKLRALFPMLTYRQIAARMRRRSYYAVRHRAQVLGLTEKRHRWTGAEIARLRKVYCHGTIDEVRAAFPEFTYAHIKAIAHDHGFKRPRRPFVATGVPALDQIRAKAFELHYTMRDVDALARSKAYFRRQDWHSGHVHHRAIAKAIAALDGEVKAAWRD